MKKHEITYARAGGPPKNWREIEVVHVPSGQLLEGERHSADLHGAPMPDPPPLYTCIGGHGFDYPVVAPPSPDIEAARRRRLGMASCGPAEARGAAMSGPDVSDVGTASAPGGALAAPHGQGR